VEATKMQKAVLLLLAAVFVVLVTATRTDALCIPSPSLPGTIHAYVSFYIESLSYVDQGDRRVPEPAVRTSGRDSLIGLTLMLRDMELAAKDFECAARVFGEATMNPFTNPRDDLERRQSEMAKKIAAVAGGGYLLLAQTRREFISMVSRNLDGSLPAEQMAQRVASLSARDIDTLSALPMLSATIANLLVDSTPDAAGKLSSLRITRREQDDLLKTIDARFAERARVPIAAGVPYIDAAAATLRHFLTTSAWRYRTAP
jgi:hypothetical protein